LHSGLGLGLAKLFLNDPDAKVILTTRSSPAILRDALPEKFPATLIGIFQLNSTSDTDAAALRQELSSKISKIDTVIANAGVGESFVPVRDAPLEELRHYFEVNTLGPIKLFQELCPYLDKSDNPKFILITSILGCITEMDPTPCGGYGASKAAANYLVRKMHLEDERLVAVALHPG
jgi:norsolorinic acid ketoreductase